ncbi:MAG: hypothetical protein H6709_08085 [Kofleriaceae bacterium]|nr:hypothetical protein [Kofleriaceae bacterium]
MRRLRARPRCPGLDAGYVARFGAGELVAQRAAVTSDEPGPAALAALLPAE